MFCSNCGKQIQDNANFCDYCGAQQSVKYTTGSVEKTTAQQYVPVTESTQQPKSSKKKSNIIITLVVVLGVFLLGKFVIAPLMTSDYNNNSSSQNNQIQISSENNEEASIDTTNPEYEAVFDGTYIVHFRSFFDMETASFALKQDNGNICCADYGYEDDVVKQWVETIYIPVSNYTEEQKAELESNMKSEFATLEALSCCSVKSEMGANYYTITCTYSDMDNEDNYSELYEANILPTNNFISMSATEETLLTQGFIKK